MTQQHDEHSTGTGNADTNSLTADAAAQGMAARGPAMPESGVNPKLGAAPAFTAADQRERDFEKLQQGWGVFGADGEQLGSIAEIGPSWFSLRYGHDDERTMYIPEEYIETVAGVRVVLNQPAGLLMDMKLDSPPVGAEEAREGRGGVHHAPSPGDPGWAVAAEEAAGEPLGLRTQQQMSPTPNAPQPRPAPPATADPNALPSAQAGVEADRAFGGDPPPPGDGPARASLTGGAPSALADLRVSGDGPGAEMIPVSQGSTDDMYVDERIESRGDRLYALDATVDPHTVVRNVRRGQPEPAKNDPSTHMEPAPGESLGPPSLQVNAIDNFYHQADQRTGIAVSTTSGSFDPIDGPTHQPGVMPGHEHLPNRTQISEVGVPGDGKERFITDTNLYKNRHPDGHPFDTQSATVGRPLRPGQPSAGNRAIEGPQGFPVPPPATVNRPALDAPPEPQEH